MGPPINIFYLGNRKIVEIYNHDFLCTLLNPWLYGWDNLKIIVVVGSHIDMKNNEKSKLCYAVWEKGMGRQVGGPYDTHMKVDRILTQS